MTADYEALWGETWGGMQDIGPVHRHNRQIIVDLIRPLGVKSILDVQVGEGGFGQRSRGASSGTKCHFDGI